MGRLGRCRCCRSCEVSGTRDLDLGSFALKVTHSQCLHFTASLIGSMPTATYSSAYEHAQVHVHGFLVTRAWWKDWQAPPAACTAACVRARRARPVASCAAVSACAADLAACGPGATIQGSKTESHSRRNCSEAWSPAR